MKPREPQNGNFLSVERTLNLTVIPCSKETKIHFEGCDQARLLKEEIVASFADTGHVCFVRLKFRRPAKSSTVSKDSKPVFLMWHGGAALAHIEERGQRWVRAIRLREPTPIRRCPMPYRVDVGVCEDLPENLDEIFYFPGLPAEIASLESEGAKLEWLQKACVADLLKREAKQLDETAERLKAEQLKGTPARPLGGEDVDHYENWRQAVEKLLCKKWPNLSTALKGLAMANNEQQKRRVLAAYVADYRTIFEQPPDVKTEDMAKLATDPYYIGLMNKAMNGGGAPVKTVLWQLAIGWLAKDYYRMNEAQLEVAFNNDWDYRRSEYKGNTLAKYAREKIGLCFALKRGRPEKPNALPPS